MAHLERHADRSGALVDGVAAGRGASRPPRWRGPFAGGGGNAPPAISNQALKNASRSALTMSACVVIIPWGKSL
ncbi:hypothetical protein D9M73_188300 [compost metagenome]